MRYVYDDPDYEILTAERLKALKAAGLLPSVRLEFFQHGAAFLDGSVAQDRKGARGAWVPVTDTFADAYNASHGWIRIPAPRPLGPGEVMF